MLKILKKEKAGALTLSSSCVIGFQGCMSRRGVSEAEKRWVQFFKDPAAWLDIRGGVSQSQPPRGTGSITDFVLSKCAPDFRHATTGESLSIGSCPKWLRDKLAALEDPPYRSSSSSSSSSEELRARWKQGEGPKNDKLGSVVCEAWKQQEEKTKTKEKSASEFVAALKQCSNNRDLESGRKLHLDAVAGGCHNSNYVGAALIRMYGKCRSMGIAREVFESIKHPDVFAWTCLISGYSDNGQNDLALEMFAKMDKSDCQASPFTYSAVLKACAGLGSSNSNSEILKQARMSIHRRIKERGLESDMILASALVDMYCKCGEMHLAREVFERMNRKNVITWTSLILGYVENGDAFAALELFASMDCKPDSLTYVAALKACASLGKEHLEKGVEIHKQMEERGILVLDSDSDSGADSRGGLVLGSTLVDMYCKCGSMGKAREVFERMKVKNAVAWNCLILGYVENGDSCTALDLFLARMDCEANHVTYVAALKACGSLAALASGRWIHWTLCRLGIEEDVVIATALVDFYAKSGCMVSAAQVFDGMVSPNQVTWNALIAGYSSIGEADEVFRLARKMREEGEGGMNSATMVSILAACSHAGLVDEGKKWFDWMMGNLNRGGNLRPTVEHCNCMVDMLGRANRVKEALGVVRSMPFEADCVSWRTLLGACRKWKEVEVGRIAFQALVAKEPGDAFAYVMMRDICQSLGMDHHRSSPPPSASASQLSRPLFEISSNKHNFLGTSLSLSEWKFSRL